jgi:hypothetical protein
MSNTDHLVPLDPAVDFSLWREFVVRSAGFPAAWATNLHSESAVGAAAAYNAAIERRDQLLDELKRNLREEMRDPSNASRRSIGKLLKKLGGARPFDASRTCDEALSPRLAPLLTQARAAEGALHALREVYGGEVLRVTALLQDRIREGRLREAIAWESLGALEAIDKFLSRPPAELDRQKGRERCYRALSYLQRLCVKNDSIGFFGPVSWGSFTEDEPIVEFDHGDPVMARHEHYFEGWALNNVARLIAAERLARSWLPLRRLPSIAIIGNTVKLPMQPAAERGAAVTTALGLSDGGLCTHELIAELSERGLASPEEAAKLVDSLETEGLLFRVAELPRSETAENALDAWLRRMPADVSAPHRQRLEKVEAARQRVTAACGDADAVRDALLGIQQEFETQTGQPGARGGGGFYEARCPVFQEGQRNMTIRLGRDVLRELRAPLGALLRVVRWYTQTIAVGVTDKVRAVLVRNGAPRVEALGVIMDVLGEIPAVVKAAAVEMRQRWHDAIDPLADGPTVDPRAACVAIDERFPRLPISWELSRHASPDLMIAATDIESVRNGDYLLVLGELHVAVNTLLAGLHLGRDPRVLAEWTRRDVKRAPLLGDWFDPAHSVRSVRPDDCYGASWIIPHHRNTNWLNQQVVPLATLYVQHLLDDGVIAHCDASAREWGVPDMFNPGLGEAAAHHFRLGDDAPHTERLRIGRLVVRRAQWVVPASDLGFIGEDQPWQRFAALRGWLLRTGVPRHVFVKVASEKKPIYFDFQSPLYGELFVRLVRKLPDGAQVTISEMLPGPEQLWLRDAQANRYTAELRCVSVDTS